MSEIWTDEQTERQHTDVMTPFVGKTIAAFEFDGVQLACLRTETPERPGLLETRPQLEAIVFTDGTRLVFSTQCGEDSVYVEAKGA